MKRFLTFILAAIMILTAMSCVGDTATGTVATTSAQDETKPESTTAVDTPSPAPSDEAGFYAGYARVDITPDFSVPIGSNMTDRVQDNTYATIIAVSDGENSPGRSAPPGGR